jgi:hypothetical protein
MPDDASKREDPVEKVAKRISAWKVIVSAAGVLIVAGGSGALYFTRYAKKTELKSAMDAHTASSLHVDMAARVVVVEQAAQKAAERLVRVETAAEDIKAQQNRIEDKLDWIILQRSPGRPAVVRNAPGGEPPPAPRPDDLVP